MQTTLVAVIIIASIFYLAFYFYKSFKSNNQKKCGGCGKDA